MNEEESRDRKQSGTEGKGRRIKTRREGIEVRGEEKERGEKRGGRNPGRLREAKILLSLPLERAKKKKKRRGPRSVLPVRIPTGSLAIQTRKRRE